MKQQIQRQQKTAVTVTQQPALTAQILAQAGLSVQTATPGQPQVTTLVKTTSGGQSVTIPMTGIAIPQVSLLFMWGTNLLESFSFSGI